MNSTDRISRALKMFEECVKTIQNELGLDIEVIVEDCGARYTGTLDLIDVRFEERKVREA